MGGHDAGTTYWKGGEALWVALGWQPTQLAWMDGQQKPQKTTSSFWKLKVAF